MLESKRQEQIYQIIQKEGHVKFRDLSKKFDVASKELNNFNF
ncbi:hypothetical protein GCM10026983_18600 [Gracilibacillus alcaliphilus]